MFFSKLLTDKLKKILLILHLPPPIHGPAVIGEYINQSTLINSEFDCNYINLSISSSLGDIGAKSSSKIFRFLNLIWQVKKQLIFNRPKLCYITLNSTGGGFYKDSLIALLVKIFRVKCVYHLHNKGISNRKISLFENILYKLIFRNAYVILISERLYYDIERFVPHSMVRYCTNGISEALSDRTQHAEHRTKGISSGTCNLLFFSNLIESKGIFTLLEACQILKEKKLSFNCTFSGEEGDITEMKFLSKVRELHLEDCVCYAGKKLEKEKEKLFLKADIFVHPSHSDCLPLVILEAMQHSLPVVSTFEGAIPDAVENEITGFLVPQKDPKALSEKLELLIRDSILCSKMGQAGRKRFESFFNLHLFEQKLCNIIKDI